MIVPFNCYLLLYLLQIAVSIYLPCDNKHLTVVTDFDKDNCIDSYYVNNYHGCFPGCFNKTDGDIYCDTNEDCPPGTYCNDDVPIGDIPKCSIDDESCFKFGIDSKDNPYYGRMWSPDCLNDGTWAPKQCKGEAANGRCFCYDTEGKRIFGQEFSDKAKDMTCGCSRRRSELEQYGSRSYITQHCDSVGNYEPLQCDSKLCWCADPKSGKLTSAVVPVTAMSLLSCYDKESVGDIYLRQCESEKYGQVKVAEKLYTHGTLFANFQPLYCDPDGSYASVKIKDSEVFCNWRDNTNLESWHVPLNSNGDISDINCNCARDRKIYQLQGKTPPLKCEDNGNYASIQKSSDKYYCVDSDGIQTTEETSEIPKDCDKFTKIKNLINII